HAEGDDLLYIGRGHRKGETMRRWWKSVGAAWGLLMVVGAAAAAPPCDEYDPFGPARSARITLTPSDFVDESRDEMRSFIATDSIGKVDVAVVSASPPHIIRAVSALPEVSGLSVHYGEKLKGIGVAVWLASTARPARVVLEVRQV